MSFTNRLSRPQIYLAGPMVFYPEERMSSTFSRMKEICAEVGLEGVAPVDGQMDLTGIEPGKPLYKKIVEADMALMDKCDGAIICLDSFRGAEMDAGTAFEVGYLSHNKTPMSGWTSDIRDYRERTIHHSKDEITMITANRAGATSGNERDRDGMLVHSAGLYQNCMVQIGIEQTGGEVYADKDWQVAFRAAALKVKRQIDLKRANEAQIS